MAGDSWVVIENRFGDVAKALHKVGSELVRKAAFDIQAGARQRARVDTGYMRSSVYVVTHDKSTYGEGLEGAGELLPEIPKPKSDTEAWCAVGAAHGVFTEYGTYKMAAAPFLTPAADAARGPFLAALNELEGALRKALG